MTRKVAIVGSKSLRGYGSIYRKIDDIVSAEIERGGEFILVNGGEEGVDQMAAEIAFERGLEYELVPLEKCPAGCASGREYCIEHSYRPRSQKIAREADMIYRIYDESCVTSTCEITARFGDELGKTVVREPVDVLLIER